MVAYGSLVADGVREEGGAPWKCETGFDLSRVYICTPMLKSYIHMKIYGNGSGRLILGDFFH